MFSGQRSKKLPSDQFQRVISRSREVDGRWLKDGNWLNRVENRCSVFFLFRSSFFFFFFFPPYNRRSDFFSIFDQSDRRSKLCDYFLTLFLTYTTDYNSISDSSTAVGWLCIIPLLLIVLYSNTWPDLTPFRSTCPIATVLFYSNAIIDSK